MNNKILLLFFCPILFVIIQNTINGKEQANNMITEIKLSWEPNDFDSQKFQQQLESIRKLGGVNRFVAETEKINKIEEILQILPVNKQSIKFIDKVSINQKRISGYKIRNSESIILYNADSMQNTFDLDFFVNQTKWSVPPDLQTHNKTEGHIRMRICCAVSFEDAANFLVRNLCISSMPLENIFSLYKFDKGPGDICFVSANSKGLNDRRVVFIRGNIGISLSSYYKNFGCMDLACRLDALIVEQMKKQQKQEKIKEKEDIKQ
ncbi:MAG: hypothetical protein LBU34_17750 [Planctomycetaceae bacterium]|jgi:hypothetical protein|nr:hypothetical protein [Planctomycetaceae bacterium]